jgi:predicted ferric reductase
MNKVVEFLLGRRKDWHLSTPWIRAPRIAIHWIGPLVMLSTVIGTWFSFSGTNGLDQASTFSMWVGAVSILLMAWSFVLALRISLLERAWGGLDSMYRGHRWSGSLAIVFMFLHTSIEPETRGAAVIPGASDNAAETAEDLAGTGQTILYILIGLSLVRLIPYRWWRWTHKLFGIPFAFASWHFYTARKPFDNASAWGWFFTVTMLVGLAAWLVRILVRDTVAQGTGYTVKTAETSGSITRISLAPTGEALDYKPGQFAFLRIDTPGMKEPHPFSIASAPSSGELEFYIRDLGDWTGKLRNAELAGASVKVEGPYGTFEPVSHHHDQTVWVAGGVGITPFLALLREPGGITGPTTLLYAVRNIEGDPIVELLQAAHDSGLISLELFSSGNRLSKAALDEHFPNGMSGTHVALCGPASLVQSLAQAASARGASSIETEDFDIRQGFGPDRSREIDEFTQRVASVRN